MDRLADVKTTNLNADSLLDRLGHLEQRYKRAGDILHAEGIHLASVEVIRMVAESKPKPAPLEWSELLVRQM